MDLTLFTLSVLFLSGLVAGTMDTIAGGGGLITVPVLFSFPWSPVEAFGTNKFQSTFGSFSATYHFWKAGKIARGLLLGVLFTAAGAFSGAVVVNIVPALWLKKFIPFLLFAIAIILFFAKGFEHHLARADRGQGIDDVLAGVLRGRAADRLKH